MKILLATVAKAMVVLVASVAPTTVLMDMAQK